MGYRFRLYVHDKTKDKEKDLVSFAYLHWSGAMHSSLPITYNVAVNLEKEFGNMQFSINPFIRDRQLKDIVATQLIKNTSARPPRKSMRKLGFDVSNIGKYPDGQKGMSLLDRIQMDNKPGDKKHFYDSQSKIILDEDKLYSGQWDLQAVFHINILEDYSITIDHDFGVFDELENDGYIGDCYCKECNKGDFCKRNIKNPDIVKQLDDLNNIEMNELFTNMSITDLDEIWDNTNNSILKDYMFFKVNNTIYHGY